MEEQKENISDEELLMELRKFIDITDSEFERMGTDDAVYDQIVNRAFEKMKLYLIQIKNHPNYLKHKQLFEKEYEELEKTVKELLDSYRIIRKNMSFNNDK